MRKPGPDERAADAAALQLAGHLGMREDDAAADEVVLGDREVALYDGFKAVFLGIVGDIDVCHGMAPCDGLSPRWGARF